MDHEAVKCVEQRTQKLVGASLFLRANHISCLLSVVRAALRMQYRRERIEKELSSFYMASELHSTHNGMRIAIPGSEWLPFQEMTPSQLGSALVDMAASVRLARYRKHRRGPKRPVPLRTRFRNHSHVSTAKLLAAATSAP